MKTNTPENAQRAELKFALACMAAGVCAIAMIVANVAFAQVAKPGSKEERETDAKALTEKTS
ncbi:MAG: hypothetical protein ACRDAM_18375, partial [Casimicrobium sp.]